MVSLLEILLIYNQRTDMCGRSAGFSTAWFYTPQERFDKRWITALQSNHRLDFDIRLHACTGISLLIKSTTRACDALLFWTCVCGEEDGGCCESLYALHWTSKAKRRQLLLKYCCWKTHKQAEHRNTTVSVYAAPLQHADDRFHLKHLETKHSRFIIFTINSYQPKHILILAKMPI